MTQDFYQSLSNGDWLAWSAVCAMLLVILAATVASIESQKP